MGMIVEGRWVEGAGASIRHGSYSRTASTVDRHLSDKVIESIRNGSGRYILVASLSCPWSHRLLLLRALKALEPLLPLHLAGGPRYEGYGLLPDGPVASGLGWSPRHVHQLYALGDPNYTGPSTVPILWDGLKKRVVSNDSAKILRGLDAVDAPEGFTLVPADLRAEIDTLNDVIYTELANGVYRAGLAQRQDAYDAAVTSVFTMLDTLETRLADRRYLFGKIVTEADWRLFATLVRFDTVYATHFRCTRRRLVDYPNLWAWTRDLYRWRGVKDTIDFAVIRIGYYTNDGTHNPHRIIAEQPVLDWHEPESRDHLGPPQVWFRQGGPRPVNRQTLQPLSD